MSDVDESNREGVVAVIQRIAAPREIVFSYLIDPARFVLWMGLRAELDARPGGQYQIRVGPDNVASGQYQVVEPPRRIVFTWGWEGSATVPPGSTTVEVLLTEDGEDTILELRHRGLPDEESRRSHREGWGDYLVRLNALLEVATRPGAAPAVADQEPVPIEVALDRIGAGEAAAADFAGAFPVFDEGQMAKLRPYGAEAQVEAQHVFFREGDADPDLILVLEGEVQAVAHYGAGAEPVYYRFHPGQFVGVMSLLTGEGAYVTTTLSLIHI